jgi:peptide/nickel transport system permease protein
LIRFILRRLAVIPIALLLVHFLGFGYAHLARPLRAARNPFFASLADPEPLLPTYKNYLQNALHLDFATIPTSPGVDEPLFTAIGRASVASLGLMAIALVLSTLIGLLLGLLSVRPAPPRIARWLTILSTIGLAMPSFYIGSLLVWALISYLLRGGFGTQLPLPIRGFGWDKHLVLPTLALMARPTAQIAQVTAELLREELEKQYVVAARSVGFTWRVILRRNALHNIVASVILSIAGSVRLLVSELIVVEWLFVWPGLGRLLASTLIPASTSTPTQAPLFLNPSAVAAVLMVFAGLFLTTDFIAAFLVRVADPRLRSPIEEGTHA